MVYVNIAVALSVHLSCYCLDSSPLAKKITDLKFQYHMKITDSKKILNNAQKNFQTLILARSIKTVKCCEPSEVACTLTMIKVQ